MKLSKVSIAAVGVVFIVPMTLRIPQYLLRMLKDYLKDRELLYDTAEVTYKKQITAGATQGSILGPDLWNIFYGGILRMQMPDDTFLLGYADDIGVVITAGDTEDAQRKLNQTGKLLDGGPWP